MIFGKFYQNQEIIKNKSKSEEEEIARLILLNQSASTTLSESKKLSNMKKLPDYSLYRNLLEKYESFLTENRIELKTDEVYEGFHDILSEVDPDSTNVLNEISMDDFMKALKEKLEKIKNYAAASSMIFGLVSDLYASKIEMQEVETEIKERLDDEKEKAKEAFTDAHEKLKDRLKGDQTPQARAQREKSEEMYRKKMDDWKAEYEGTEWAEHTKLEIEEGTASIKDQIKELEEEISELGNLPMEDWQKKSFAALKAEADLEGRKEMLAASKDLSKAKQEKAKKAMAAQEKKTKEAEIAAAEAEESAANKDPLPPTPDLPGDADQADKDEFDKGKVKLDAAVAAQGPYKQALSGLTKAKQEVLAAMETNESLREDSSDTSSGSSSTTPSDSGDSSDNSELDKAKEKQEVAQDELSAKRSAYTKAISDFIKWAKGMESKDETKFKNSKQLANQKDAMQTQLDAISASQGKTKKKK
jgi:hypothetical protein